MELKTIQTIPKTVKDEIKLMSSKKFSYGKMFDLIEASDEYTGLPHIEKAKEYGIDHDDIPVSSRLRRYNDSVGRIDALYNMKELEHIGIDVSEKLMHMSEQELLDEIEELEIEQPVSSMEAYRNMEEIKHVSLNAIPKNMPKEVVYGEFESTFDGRTIDISAFGSNDFVSENEQTINKFKYAADKIAEKARDIAIMYSSISTNSLRQDVKDRFDTLVNSKYRNQTNEAITILNLIKNNTIAQLKRAYAYLKNFTQDNQKCSVVGRAMRAYDKPEVQNKLREGIVKSNVQIVRLQYIWKNVAYSG